VGGKRKRKGQCFYLCAACLIIISLAGCAALKEMKTSRDAREHINTANALFDRGDYEGSLRENQKVISMCDDSPPGDEALFNSGVVYAHPGYPRRDLQKSADYFKKLQRSFPHSPFAARAKVFMGLLHDNERSKREIEALNKAIRKSKQVDMEIEEKKKGF